MPPRLITPPRRKGRPHPVVRVVSFLVVLGVSGDLAYATFTGLLAANLETETAGDLAFVVFVMSLAVGLLVSFVWYFAGQMKGARLDIVTIALVLQETSNATGRPVRRPFVSRTRRGDVRLRAMLRRTRK